MQCEKNNDCRTIVINNQGSVFCSGHNIKDLNAAIQTQNQNDWKHIFEICSDLLVSLQNCPLPIIAQLKVAILRNFVFIFLFFKTHKDTHKI